MKFFRKTFPRAVAAAALILAVALPAADAPFAPEVQQRLDLLKTGYETFVLNNTTIPYEAGIKTLNERVKPTLERESAAAAQRTDLDTLVRIKADLERLGEGQVLTAVEEAPPAALKHTYSAYKLELSRLESAQKTSLADAKRRYDKGLELVQKELTKAQDVTAALQVKQLREELADAAAPTTANNVGNATSTTGNATSTMVKAPAPGENLLSNGSFEKGLTKWELTTWNREVESKMVMDKKELFHDRATLRVTNPALNDTHIAQRVKVKPATRYRMAGFIKAQEIKDAKGNTGGIPGVKVQGGGCLSVSGQGRYSTSFVSTDSWTEVSREFKTQDETEVVFECRLGYFSAPVTGTAWFAELSLTEVQDSAPPMSRAAASKQVVELVKSLGGEYKNDSAGDDIKLPKSKLTTADLLQIGAANGLKSFVWTGGSGLTDEGMAAFEGMKNLDNLFLWDVGSITDAGLNHLSGCTRLEVLNIGANSGDFTGAGLEHLSQCKSLRKLNLSYLRKLDGKNLRFLVPLKSLEILLLSECKGITDADLDVIAQMSQLKTLELGKTGVTDAGLAKLTGLRQLQELFVSAPLVTPEGVKVLTRAIPALVVNFTK